MRLRFSVWTFLIMSLNIYCQSFFVTKKNDTVYTNFFSISKGKFEYKPVNSKKNIEIELDKIKGFYSEKENAFYENKKEFAELIIEGDIKLFRSLKNGTSFIAAGNTTYGTDTQYAHWFIEKDSLFEKVFSSGVGNTHFGMREVHYSLSNRDILEKVISDDKIALKKLESIKKKGELPIVLKLINDYNSRKFKNNSQRKNNIDEDSAKIVLFRESKNETKNAIRVTVNGKIHKLEKSSRIDLIIPSTSQSEIYIENSTNKYSMITTSSKSYIKYYRLRLNKKNEGYIEKINGNSRYYKVRLRQYNKSH
ncbi:hypothetical protein [Algibacter mikhailovii]|uniref:Uncharacterized protein n=1 Tax=Algibacter mikhailovii TaxID=425498 RepID=A0A918V5R4_9FLAO|nr:hypothetical protein [Algibacter mikhailovii]GGZ71694.1 hypothetical protein GCM10007028_06320 [Algibacter mikhailovii]